MYTAVHEHLPLACSDSISGTCDCLNPFHERGQLAQSMGSHTLDTVTMTTDGAMSCHEFFCLRVPY